MGSRRIAAALLLVVLLLIEFVVLFYASRECSYTALLIEKVVCSVLGLLIVSLALRKYGPLAFQAIRMYRSCGCVFSRDHSLENFLLNMLGFLFAGAALLIPGLITDLVGLLVLFVRPLRSLVAATIIWVIAPDVFGGTEDSW